MSADVGSLASMLARRLQTRIDADLRNGGNTDIFGETAELASELAALLERSAAEVSRRVAAAEATVEARAKSLAERHAKQDAEYRELVAKLQEETGKTAERVQLQSRHAEVVAAGKDLELRRSDRRDKHAQREELTTRLSVLRDERYALRKRVTEQLTKQLQPMIRVTIAQSGNRDAYRALLTEALKGQNMRYAAVVEKIVQTASPAELCVFIQSDDAETLADRIEIDAPRARRVIDAFRGSKLLCLACPNGGGAGMAGSIFDPVVAAMYAATCGVLEARCGRGHVLTCVDTGLGAKRSAQGCGIFNTGTWCRCCCAGTYQRKVQLECRFATDKDACSYPHFNEYQECMQECSGRPENGNPPNVCSDAVPPIAPRASTLPNSTFKNIQQY